MISNMLKTMAQIKKIANYLINIYMLRINNFKNKLNRVSLLISQLLFF